MSDAPQPTRSFPGGPRRRVAFLVAVAVGVFFIPRWWGVAIALAAMVAAWVWLGLGGQRVRRQIRKLIPISLLFIAGYALFSDDPARDQWWTLDLGFVHLDLNAWGAKDAGKMRAEGKEYVVKDGDVMNFLFSS